MFLPALIVLHGKATADAEGIIPGGGHRLRKGLWTSREQVMDESNMSDPKMNCPSESKSESCDEPLFVLKYRRGKAAFRLLGIFTFLLMSIIAVFYATPAGWLKYLFLKVSGTFFLFLCSLMFIDVLLFREVRLYKDRMVKIWRFIGKREVQLANAHLRCNSGAAIGTGRFKNGPYSRYKTIFDRQTNVALAYIKGVSYDEKLADPDDVKKLNTLLADLTGRKVEEFEEPRIRMDRLIQEERR